ERPRAHLLLGKFFFEENVCFSGHFGVKFHPSPRPSPREGRGSLLLSSTKSFSLSPHGERARMRGEGRRLFSMLRSSSSARDLLLEHLSIKSAPLDEFGVGAALDDPALL